VLYNSDGIESFGFVEHLKLPHFVTFGSGLQISLDEESVRKPEGATTADLVGAYPNSAVGAIQ
jgi:alpha-D-ribose 1-methylphosphonate 5-triphosphate synthase subunit PhnI